MEANLFLLLTALLFTTSADAQNAPEKPFLHRLFSDNMVLQRDIATPVWGWAKIGTEVSVSLNGKEATAKADANGKWMVNLPAQPVGGPYELKVNGQEEVTLKNVMLGDVWICSGQSNMEWGMWGTTNSKEEIAAANHPNIRLYTVAKKISLEPEEQVAGQWQVCSPETVGGFSAVGFFFGRKLNKELNVAIGLINSSWGGTICEAWASAEALNELDDFKPAIARLKEMIAEQNNTEKSFEQKMQEWWAQNDPGSAKDAVWEKAETNTEGWKTMGLPKVWEQTDLGNFDGVVWFRKEVTVPEEWAGKDLALGLGPIDDRDTTWFNGVKVGEMNTWNQARNYKVPGKAVKAGKNVIAIRVLDTGGGGGLYGQPEELKLSLSGDKASKPISLSGDWLFKDSTPLAKTSQAPRQGGGNPNYSSFLYNGMIAPLIPSAIKGAIWYQGESNAGRGLQYRTLLPTMIKDWRSRFGVGEFPFYVVQLANFMRVEEQPSDPAWAHLREAQLMTALNDPNCGLAVIIDIGAANNIHPTNKQDVGHRLALSALGQAYGKDIVHSGPIYKSMKVEGSSIRLTFDHIGGGLVARDGALKGFAIAGADKKFVWADARIDGDTIVVSSKGIESPAMVRYAWANNPICNLYNKEALPASPFRTDQ
ncbi:MAG: 9-O-acetylesterase [Planctomycetota bacterium]|nr:9-O-acetylesterase [Planctomycetota bacterium]MDA1140039.1 9-O-acetylesterase [Planctomycetota bacterium]